MGVRREYTVNDARIPEFTSRFRKKVDELGGVTKVSELSGISRPTLNFWYNGQRTPDAVSLITLARCFKVSSDWLLGLAVEDNYSNDEKEKLISEYTGLSTNAVKILHRNATDKGIDKRYFPILGEILSFNSIYESIGCLIRAKHFKEKDQEMMASNPDAYKQMDAIIKSLNDNLNMSDRNDPNVILTNGEAAEYYINRASEWYTNLCKHIVNGGVS